MVALVDAAQDVKDVQIHAVVVVVQDVQMAADLDVQMAAIADVLALVPEAVAEAVVDHVPDVKVDVPETVQPLVPVDVIQIVMLHVEAVVPVHVVANVRGTVILDVKDVLAVLVDAMEDVRAHVREIAKAALEAVDMLVHQIAHLRVVLAAEAVMDVLADVEDCARYN